MLQSGISKHLDEAKRHLPRSRWVYVIAAIALLAASEALWLWHSWPVREILESERPVAGLSL